MEVNPSPMAIDTTPEVRPRQLAGTISMCTTLDTDWVIERMPTTSVKPMPAAAQCGTSAMITRLPAVNAVVMTITGTLPARAASAGAHSAAGPATSCPNASNRPMREVEAPRSSSR